MTVSEELALVVHTVNKVSMLGNYCTDKKSKTPGPVDRPFSILGEVICKECPAGHGCEPGTDATL